MDCHLGCRLGYQADAEDPGAVWAAAWYGTVVAICFFVMYLFIYDVQ